MSGSADAALRCLGLDVGRAHAELCARNIRAGLETLCVPKSVAEAGASRDAVARSIYARTFDWLVALVNANLNWCAPGGPGALSGAGGGAGVIGLLDIFGFEVLAENSFEQVRPAGKVGPGSRLEFRVQVWVWVRVQIRVRVRV